MRSRFVALIVVTVMLLSNGVATADTGFNNDLNNDLNTDKLHKKPDNIELWNEQSYCGYVVNGILVASIDPHWNQKIPGQDDIRVFTRTDNVNSALQTSCNGNPSINPYATYPSSIETVFNLMTTSDTAEIDNVLPDTGSVSFPWSLLIALTGIAQGIPAYSIYGSYILSFLSPAQSAVIQSVNGGTKNYAFNTTYFSSKPTWQQYTTDLPSSISTQSAYVNNDSTYGVPHEYNWHELTWSHGSQHPVMMASKIHYLTTSNGIEYAYDTGFLYLGYNEYGF